MTYLGLMRDRLTTPISTQPPSYLYDITCIGKTITEMTKAQTSARHIKLLGKIVGTEVHTYTLHTCRNNGVVEAMSATVAPLFMIRRPTVRINSGKVGFQATHFLYQLLLWTFCKDFISYPCLPFHRMMLPEYVCTPLYFTISFFWLSQNLLHVVSREYIISGT